MHWEGSAAPLAKVVSVPAPVNETVARPTGALRPRLKRDRPSNGGNQGAGAGPSAAITTVMEPDPELFREVFGRFVTGVAVITSAARGGAGGMTANAFCSLSLDPQLVLVCFENEARTLPIVREAGRFGVNMLTAEQEELAGVFASKMPEAEKLEGVAHRIEHGVPLIDDTLAWAVCGLVELIAGGDHTIAIGDVIAMGLGEGEPLLYYGGRYHAGAL